MRELLALFAGLYPAPRPVAEVLELVDLADEQETRIGALSGGQRRRVDLGVGIIGRPEVLFLDEPTTGLDPEARRRVWAGVADLAAAGTTVLLTTHYLEEAERLADRLLVLSGGRIVADTDPHALRARSGLSTIRFPLSHDLAHDLSVTGLPPALRGHVDAAEDALLIRTAKVTPVLAELVGWASRADLDLTGLEGRPAQPRRRLPRSHR